MDLFVWSVTRYKDENRIRRLLEPHVGILAHKRVFEPVVT